MHMIEGLAREALEFIGAALIVSFHDGKSDPCRRPEAVS
jgi:hypothetical protein